MGVGAPQRAATPSACFRIRQRTAPLAEAVIDVLEPVPRIAQSMPLPGPLARVRRRHLGPLAAVWLAGHAASRLPALVASRRADAVWLERVFAPGFDWLVRGLARPIVLDVDDAVWLEGLAGRATPRLARAATVVIAGNRYLADCSPPTGGPSTSCRRPSTAGASSRPDAPAVAS